MGVINATRRKGLTAKVATNTYLDVCLASSASYSIGTERGSQSLSRVQSQKTRVGLAHAGKVISVVMHREQAHDGIKMSSANT